MLQGHPNQNKCDQLLKEATSLKKSDIKNAIKKIEDAIQLFENEDVLVKSDALFKLADYYRISGNFTKSVQILYNSYKSSLESKNYQMRIMYASIFISYIDTLYKKEFKKNSDFETYGSILYAIAMACQGRYKKEYMEHGKSSENNHLIQFLKSADEALMYLDSNAQLDFETQEEILEEVDYDYEKIFPDNNGEISQNDWDTIKWKEDKLLNQIYDSLISNIDESITTYKNTVQTPSVTVE